MTLLDKQFRAWYDYSMKTAISMPDPLFDAAEKLAKRLKLSRSALYARALEDYVRRNSPDTITEQLNRALAAEPDEPDPFMAAAATSVMRRAEWDE